MKCFTGKPKAILVPYPAQGHVTPMINLATQLLSHGLQPVVVTPNFIHRRIRPQTHTDPSSSSSDSDSDSDSDGDDDDNGRRILYISIPDGIQVQSEDGNPCGDFFAIETAMEMYMPSHLQRILLQFQKQDGGVSCLIADLLASYAFDVADRCGVRVAGFWPAMLATYRLIAAIPRMLDAGFISETGCPQSEASTFFSLGGLQVWISADELPWLIGTSTARKSRFRFWKRTMERSRSLRWLVVNTFQEEEEEEECGGTTEPLMGDSANESRYPLIFPIQPKISSTNTAAAAAAARKASFWEEDMSCLEWLDKQRAGSVVYISFGSWVSPIGEAKVRNLALSLEATGRPFLWVLGKAWLQGLPRGGGYTERVLTEQGKGKIVSWAPQLEVLKHVAVGCYLTHCGWNSTVEAIECKKPLLCWPIAGDQFLNCAYIVKVWRIGVRIKGFGQRELEEGLEMVMEDMKMRERVIKLGEKLMSKEAGRKAVDNLTTFVHGIRSAPQSIIDSNFGYFGANSNLNSNL